jgi:16S rRNA (cytosine967-C5)-methyltransferase
MMIPFRKFHLLQMLTGYLAQSLPLDLCINQYFRLHKALGSKDRLFIADTAYTLVRWDGLLTALSQPDPSLERKIDLLLSEPIEVLRNRAIQPLEAHLSFPSWLLNRLIDLYGIELATQICLESNRQAPASIRANLLKTSRESLFETLSQTHSVKLSAYSPQGIVFDSRTNFFNLEPFKNGLFEVQDEGSQLLANLVQAKPGEHFLDYCAGSGGKTLAIAPHMGGKGQIYLHDVRQDALFEARRRCLRAGIQNVQFLHAKSAGLKRLKNKMDWILIDAPCSGTGTLRRNPDMKWRLNPQRVDELCSLQREIFTEALTYLSPQGKIVYATCSLLREENEDQRDYFLSKFPIEQLGTDFKTLPTANGPDGFFGVVFKSKIR